ncbi:hypothetical protein NC651_003649 [Populus alba x Populus x berolinensis]|nr:hypothetical protein NC651_003649 [Populus alba x Populus x berolinensis]
MVLLGVTGKNGGGYGGGYADRSCGSSSPLFLCWFQPFLFFHSPCTLKIPQLVPLFHTKKPLVLIFLSAQKPP